MCKKLDAGGNRTYDLKRASLARYYYTMYTKGSRNFLQSFERRVRCSALSARSLSSLFKILKSFHLYRNRDRLRVHNSIHKNKCDREIRNV